MIGLDSRVWTHLPPALVGGGSGWWLLSQSESTSPGGLECTPGLGASHHRRLTSLLGDDCSARVWQSYTKPPSIRAARLALAVALEVRSKVLLVRWWRRERADLHLYTLPKTQPANPTRPRTPELTGPGGRTCTEKHSKRVGSVEKTVRQRPFVLETRLFLSVTITYLDAVALRRIRTGSRMNLAPAWWLAPK